MSRNITLLVTVKQSTPMDVRVVRSSQAKNGDDLSLHAMSM